MSTPSNRGSTSGKTVSPASSASSPQHMSTQQEVDRNQRSSPASPYAGGPGSPIASAVRRTPKTQITHSGNPQYQQQQYQQPPQQYQTQQGQSQSQQDGTNTNGNITTEQLSGRAPFMSDGRFLKTSTMLEHFPRRPGSVVIQNDTPVHSYMPPVLRSILRVLRFKTPEGKIMLNRLQEFLSPHDEVALEEDDFEPFIFIKNLPELSTAVPTPRKSPIPLKSVYSPPLTLALDLDETLVHCSIHPIDAPDLTFHVNFNGQDFEVYVRIRPHLEYFLKQVSQWFEVIVFTASQKVYADSLLNIIDPKNEYITHRVFRDSCVCIEGNYLKDLNILGRPLDKVVIVDNSFQAFGFQLDNGIPIESWFEDDHDCELLHLIPFLRHLKDVFDVRPYIRDAFKLPELINAIVPSVHEDYYH